MTAMEPPEFVKLWFCPVCGRNDRFAAFTGQSHFAVGGRCVGTPVAVTYHRAVEPEASGATKPAVEPEP